MVPQSKPKRSRVTKASAEGSPSKIPPTTANSASSLENSPVIAPNAPQSSNNKTAAAATSVKEQAHKFEPKCPNSGSSLNHDLGVLEERYAKIQRVLDSGSELSEVTDEYLALTKFETLPNDAAKKFANQLILRFHTHFPDQMPETIKSLQQYTSSISPEIRKIAFANLRSVNDITIFKSLLETILSRYGNPSDEVEQKVVKFLVDYVINLDKEQMLKHFFETLPKLDKQALIKAQKYILKFEADNLGIFCLNDEISDSIISFAEKIFCDSDAEKMPETVDIIMKIPAMNNVNMRKKLLSRFKFLAKFKDPYKLTSKDDKRRIDNLFHIMRCADKIFSKNCPSDQFFEHLLHSVLPFFNSLKNEKKINFSTRILQNISNMSQSLTLNSEKSFLSILKLVDDNLPQPPTLSDEADFAEPNINIALIEPLLWTFYNLLSKNNDYMSTIEEKHKDFRLKLQYFARANQSSIERFKNMLTKHTKTDFSSQDGKTCVLGFIMSRNINKIVLDLMRKKPLYTVEISPSWKSKFEALVTECKNEINLAGQLSSIPNINENITTSERKIYHPPRGKYSSKSQTNANNGFIPIR